MKRKTNRNLSKISKIFLVATLTIYFCATFVTQEIKFIHLKQNKKAVEQDILMATQKNSEIQEQLKKENLDKYVEEIARDKLGFLKNDEVLFVDSAEK